MKYIPCYWRQPNFLPLICGYSGHTGLWNEQQKTWGFYVILLKYYLHASHSHKMALALCTGLAHLSVLKLSSELHGGGTGRGETLKILHTALL